MLSRRRFLVLVAASIAAAGCSSSGQRSDGAPSAVTEDYSSRFAAFDAAVEPNGDLTKVTWPDFVTRGGPDVQKLYEFQVTHGELMRYVPCFCGCGEDAGHRNNRDCYVKGVNADGSVIFDSMAPT